MNRRQFLGSAVAASVAAGFELWRPAPLFAQGSGAGLFGTAHRAAVTDFGADPTGTRDATPAVRRAIASLSQRNARLVFSPGRYSFAGGDGVAMAFSAYEGLEVFGNGAELSFSGGMQPLLMRNCRDVEIHDLKMDWSRPPFSQATVIEIAGLSATVLVDPEFPVDGTQRIESFAQYDPKTGLPATDGVEAEGIVSTTKLLGRQKLLLTLRRAVPLREGMHLLLLHAGGGAACFQLQACETALLESVAVYAAPGAGALMQGCRDLAFEDLSTAPRNGSRRWISASGNGLRMEDCKGTMGMKRCSFERTGSAGVEIHQSYWRLKTQVDDRTALVEARGQRPLEIWELPSPGSILQLSDPAHLKLLGEIAILKAENTPGGTKITFRETLSPVITAGTLLCNALEQPRAVLEECTFKGNRGEGLVAHGRVRIANSHFNACARPAIAMGADEGSMRGPAVQSVAITESTFTGCNYAQAAVRRGTITVDAARGLPGEAAKDEHLKEARGNPENGNQERSNQERLNQGIMIQRNTFNGDGGPAIDCVATSWLTVESNTFGKTDLLAEPGKVPRAIVLRNVDASFLELNRSRTNSSILLIGCTDKVQTSENGLLAEVRTA